MIEFNKYLDKFGFPKKNTPNNKVNIKYEDKVFLFSKFKRRFDICLKLFSFKFIDGYYHDQLLESFYYDKVRSINISNKYILKINLKLIIFFCFLIFKKKKIKLKKGDITLFGPYSHSYFHVIIEYFTRLTFLKNKNFKKTIWMPDNLRPYLASIAYKKIFKNLKYKFYETNKNIIFQDCSYLTHINTRWYIRNKKKIYSREYTQLIKQFKYEVISNHNLSKNSKFNYIIISRSKAFRRRLINETELLKKLSKHNFELIFFEDYSYQEQINIARNCKIMISYHGGGLTNLFFMNPKSLVIEISNKYYNHKLYEYLSKLLNIKYKSFFCKKSFENLNGICDVKKIVKFVDNKI